MNVWDNITYLMAKFLTLYKKSSNYELLYEILVISTEYILQIAYFNFYFCNIN